MTLLHGWCLANRAEVCAHFAELPTLRQACAAPLGLAAPLSPPCCGLDSSSETMQLDSVKKKRRKKMNKHKYKKRRKRDRFKNRNAF